MKNKIILLSILMLSLVSFGQNFSYFEKLDSTKIRIFYDYSGNISPRSNADYYREVAIRKTALTFTGKFVDFFINGDTAFSGLFINGKLYGYAKYYNENRVVEDGNYANGKRTGLWRYYYPDGKIKKIANFVDDIPYFSDFFGQNGEQLILNGNGKYIDYTNINNGKKINYKIKGDLVNSDLDGKWELTGITKENFKNGNFIDGFDVLTYRANPKISLKLLKGFYSQENVTLLKNYFTCCDCVNNLSWALYSIDNNIDSSCYSKFIIDVSKLLLPMDIGNGYFVIQFDINVEGRVHNLTVFSQYDSSLNESIEKIIFNNQWKPYRQMNNKIYKLYFPLLITDEGIYIPNPEIHTCNTESNYMNEQMKGL